MLMTANPCADAERWADEQERRASQAEALEIEALEIITAEAAQLMTPTKWFESDISGPRAFCLDELVLAVTESDDDALSELTILLTSEAAQKLVGMALLHHAKKHWRDIIGERADGL